MNRAMGRARESGIQWGAVGLGWIVALLASIVIDIILRGLYLLAVDPPIDFELFTAGALILSLISGFLAYLLGGFVAGLRAGVSGGLNGAMTAVFGLIVGIILSIILVILSLIVSGGEGLPTAPVGLELAEGAFLAVLLLLLVNLAGGYLGGRLGASRRR